MNAIPFFLGSIVYLFLMGISIYTLVLLIKLAQRGIKALDIYIEEKSNKF